MACKSGQATGASALNTSCSAHSVFSFRPQNSGIRHSGVRMLSCRFELQEGLRKYRGEGQRGSRSPNQVDFLLVEQSADTKDGYAVFFLDVRNRVRK
jgi:hypothetical protein